MTEDSPHPVLPSPPPAWRFPDLSHCIARAQKLRPRHENHADVVLAPRKVRRVYEFASHLHRISLKILDDRVDFRRRQHIAQTVRAK